MVRTEPDPGVDVAVLGCGNMGAALAKTFASAGSAVVVWNRTLERAKSIEGAGITASESVAAAVAQARLVVACVDTHESLRSALEDVRNWDGTTLVNLVSTEPDETLATAERVESLGGRYLDGAIMCYPADIGSADALLVYSGDLTAWADHESRLSALGRATFSASSVDMASTFLNGLTAFYTPALSAYVAAVAYLDRHGISAVDMQLGTAVTMKMLDRHARDVLTAVTTDEHKTDQATIEIFAKVTRKRVAGLRAAGVSTPFVEALLANLEKAEAAGLGHLGLSAQSKIL